MDAPTAIKLLLERVPFAVKEAARFRSRVWVGPDVFIPDHLAIHLSASLRYMFYKHCDARVITSAWEDFKERFKYNLHFATEKITYPEVEDQPYDPDYRVKAERKDFEGEIPRYIQVGLEWGDKYIERYTKNVVPHLVSLPKGPSLVETDRLRQFLEENEYIVSSTDKNLGVAVISRKWFIENTTKLWNDPLNYRKLSPEERQMALERKEEFQGTKHTPVDDLHQPESQAATLRWY